MRKFILLGVIALTIGLVWWWYFYDSQLQIRLTEQELESSLGKKLPIKKQYLLVFRVELDNLTVDLVEGRERVHAGLDLAIEMSVGSKQLMLNGMIEASSGILYDKDKGEFFLMDPAIEQLAIQGLPEKYRKRAQRIITKALNEYYARWPIYTLREEDLKQATTKMVLKRVQIQDERLVITLGL